MRIPVRWNLDKDPFTDEFLTYHAAIRAIDMARVQNI